MGTRLKISSITPELQQEIANELTLTPNEKSDNPSEPFKFYLIEKDEIVLPFATGMGVAERKINDSIVYPKVSVTFHGSLRPNQTDVINEATEELESYNRVLLALGTGYGKTFLSSYLAVQLGYKTAIMFTQKNLIEQWYKEITSITTFNVESVSAGTKPFIPKPETNLLLIMVGRVKRIPREIRKTFGILIIDEAHQFCNKIRGHIILQWEPKYLILCTATPRRADGMDIMIPQLVGASIVHRINDVQFCAYKVESGVRPKITRNAQGKMNWTDCITSLLLNEKRNKLIVKIVQHFVPKHKILLLTARVDHIILIHTRLVELGISCDYMNGSKHTYSDSDVLIGTYGKTGTGFDEKNACKDFGGKRIDMVILCSSVKNPTLIEQSLGRAFRSDYATFIDIVDNHGVFNKHFEARKKWYTDERRRGKVVNLVIEGNSVSSVNAVEVDGSIE